MLQYPAKLDGDDFKPQLEHILFLAKVAASVPLSKERMTQIFHAQVLKSALFSARIEGSKSTLNNASSHTEVTNVLKAITYVRTRQEAMSPDLVLKVHAQVMTNLAPEAGKWRQEQSGIFDGAGNLVFLTPDVTTMKKMLAVWIEAVNHEEGTEQGILNLARSHYYFEKIHPFIDGNGRTGRALLQWQLHQISAFGQYILPIDEYFAQHRAAYYYFLEKNTTTLHDFCQFFLDAVIWSLESLLEAVKKSDDESEMGVPLPRRQEIIEIIRDHPLCSLDFIARRFATLTRRSISNDLAWLVAKKLVVKHGSTRGVRYSL